MADLINEATLEQTSEGQSAPASDKSQTEKKQDTKKVNLHEIEDFRKYQAERDRKEAALNQQLQQQNAYMAQLQQQMDALADKDLDDFGKLQNELKRAQAREQALQQTLYQQQQAQQIQQAKYNDLVKLTTKFGLTNDQYQELWKANDPDEAMDMAIKFRDRNREKRDEEEEERRETNRVDVGGGKTSTRQARSESSERDAWEKGDAQAYIASVIANKKKK